MKWVVLHCLYERGVLESGTQCLDIGKLMLRFNPSLERSGCRKLLWK